MYSKNVKLQISRRSHQPAPRRRQAADDPASGVWPRTGDNAVMAQVVVVVVAPRCRWSERTTNDSKLPVDGNDPMAYHVALLCVPRDTAIVLACGTPALAHRGLSRRRRLSLYGEITPINWRPLQETTSSATYDGLSMMLVSRKPWMGGQRHPFWKIQWKRIKNKYRSSLAAPFF